MALSDTYSSPVTPDGGAKCIPTAGPLRKPQILQLSMCRALPLTKLTPIWPVPTPSIDRFRSVTTTPSPFTVTPLVLAATIPPKVPPQSMVIDFVMVTNPKPPESRQLTMPPSTVFETAPLKVLQGAVRLQLLASSPAPDTQARVTWASAGATAAERLPTRAVATTADHAIFAMMALPAHAGELRRSPKPARHAISTPKLPQRTA